MRYIIAILLLLCLTFSIAHGYDILKISKADMSGVWVTDKYMIWLYKDRSMKLYNGTTCNLEATGKWKFEMAQLHMYYAGREIYWSYVIEVPKKWIPGRWIRFANNQRWMFFGRDTNRICD